MKVSAEEFEDLDARFGCLSERDQRLIIAGFEQAKEQVLAKIKEKKKENDLIMDKRKKKNIYLDLYTGELNQQNYALSWLEGELK